MTDQPRTGGVVSKSGKVKARSIIVGLDILGAVDDDVVKSALETMQHLQPGVVSGEKGVEASEDIVVGIRMRYLNPDAPTTEDLIAEMKALREDLSTAQSQAQDNPDVQAAAESLDSALAEAEKPQPLGKLIKKRLSDTVEFITDAGKALEAADKAAPLIAKAVGTAAVLYQAAQLLF